MGIKSSNPPDKGERSYRKRKSSAGGIRKQAPQKVGKTSIPKKDTAPRRAIEFHPSEIQARQVYLLGDFNSWEPGSCPLKRNLSGQWEGVFPWPPGVTNSSSSRTEPGSRAEAATSAWRVRISPFLWPPGRSLTLSEPKIWPSRCARDFICSSDHRTRASKQDFRCLKRPGGGGPG